MSQELIGKWYVYRFNLANPVLKAAETSLEITGGKKACRARFELTGQNEPVEFAMTAAAGSADWHGKRGSINIRWAEDEPGVLTGQVVDREDPEQRRDFFVAVRSRRTSQLPKESVYTFGGSYRTPFKKSNSSEPKPGGISVHLDEKKIRFDDKVYTIKRKPKDYNGGLLVTGQIPKVGQPAYIIGLWILPVVDPDQPGRLLATGCYEYHGGYNTGSSRPECQIGIKLR